MIDRLVAHAGLFNRNEKAREEHPRTMESLLLLSDKPSIVLAINRYSGSGVDVVTEDQDTMQKRRTVEWLTADYWPESPDKVEYVTLRGDARTPPPVNYKVPGNEYRSRLDPIAAGSDYIVRTMERAGAGTKVVLLFMGFTGFSVSLKGWENFYKLHERLDMTLLIEEEVQNLQREGRSIGWLNGPDADRFVLPLKLENLVRTVKAELDDELCSRVIAQFDNSALVRDDTDLRNCEDLPKTNRRHTRRQQARS